MTASNLELLFDLFELVNYDELVLTLGHQWLKAAPHWVLHAGCGFARWRDFSTFNWVVGHATL